MESSANNPSPEISNSAVSVDHILVRRRHAEYFAVVRDGAVQLHAAVGASPLHRHAWSDSGALAVPLRRWGKRLIWRQIQLWTLQDGRVRRTDTLETPCPITDLAWFHGWLVVCGVSSEQPRAWVIAPFAASPHWHPLSLPDSLLAHRKSFDALAVSGNTLVVIDNQVFPKWMVTYTATTGQIPIVQTVTSLVENGPNEHVEAARAGRLVFAVRSSSVGMLQGVQQHLVVYRFDNGEAVGRIAFNAPMIDAAMVGDELLILSGGGSPAVLRYRDLDRLPSLPTPDPDSDSVASSVSELLPDERIRLDRPFDQLRRTRLGDVVIGSSERDEFVLLSDAARTGSALHAISATNC